MSSPITAQSSFTPLTVFISTVVAIAVVVALRVLRSRPVNSKKATENSVKLVTPIPLRASVTGSSLPSRPLDNAIKTIATQRLQGTYAFKNKK